MRKGTCAMHQFRVNNPADPIPVVVVRTRENQAYVVGENSGTWVDVSELTECVTAEHTAIVNKLRKWGEI